MQSLSEDYTQFLPKKEEEKKHNQHLAVFSSPVVWYNYFAFPGIPQTPLRSNMSVHHHLFARPRSQRTGPNKIFSVQEMQTKGGGGRRREGGLFVRGVIFNTLMNSFKRFSKYGLMRAGRGCHLGFICEAFP